MAHSIKSHQSSGGYDSDTGGEEESPLQYAAIPNMWRRPDRLSQKLGNMMVEVAEIPQENSYQASEASSQAGSDHHSGSSTLADDAFGYPEKTPTMLEPSRSLEDELEQADDEDEEESQIPQESPRIPGPLEQQLAALMSKIIHIESENPAVSFTQDEYTALEQRVKALEAEKKGWLVRHEALFALRDGDVSNLIKVRGLLAEERREHAAMSKLRDDDLVHVIELRGKLADVVRKLDMTPKPARPKSVALERRNTADIWETAKKAAMEHRALELEQANADLLSQIESLKQSGQAAGLDSVQKAHDGLKAENVNLRTKINLMTTDEASRVAAHRAWKNTVNDLENKLKEKDVEIARLQRTPAAPAAPSGEGGPSLDWNRIEAMHEEELRYRERMASKLQQLRSEKERLQREVDKKEDENISLEIKIEKMEKALSETW